MDKLIKGNVVDLVAYRNNCALDALSSAESRANGEQFAKFVVPGLYLNEGELCGVQLTAPLLGATLVSRDSEEANDAIKRITKVALSLYDGVKAFGLLSLLGLFFAVFEALSLGYFNVVPALIGCAMLGVSLHVFMHSHVQQGELKALYPYLFEGKNDGLLVRYAARWLAGLEKKERTGFSSYFEVCFVTLRCVPMAYFALEGDLFFTGATMFLLVVMTNFAYFYAQTSETIRSYFSDMGDEYNRRYEARLGIDLLAKCS